MILKRKPMNIPDKTTTFMETHTKNNTQQTIKSQ